MQTSSGRFTARRLRAALLAFVVVGVVVGFLAPPVVHWSGPATRTLRFRVLDAVQGTPVQGARVALIHPPDPEQAPIEAVTDVNGEVELRGVFRNCGGTDSQGRDRVTCFSYGLWGVQARSEGYQDFVAPLGNTGWTYSYPGWAHEPLELGDPAPSPINIRLSPVSGDSP